MSMNRGDMPRKPDRFYFSLPPMMQSSDTRPMNYVDQKYMIARPTSAWAIASFALSILALLGASIHLAIPLCAGALAILCGAVAIAVILIERRGYGLWMALLSIAVASLPVVLAALEICRR